VELTGTAAEMRGRIGDIQAAYLSQGDTSVAPAVRS
jgi:hypothetical protein